MENDLVVSLGGVIPDMVGSIAGDRVVVNLKRYKKEVRNSLKTKELRRRDGPAPVTR